MLPPAVRQRRLTRARARALPVSAGTGVTRRTLTALAALGACADLAPARPAASASARLAMAVRTATAADAGLLAQAPVTALRAVLASGGTPVVDTTVAVPAGTREVALTLGVPAALVVGDSAVLTATLELRDGAATLFRGSGPAVAYAPRLARTGVADVAVRYVGPATLAVVAGDAQDGTAGERLRAPVLLRVRGAGDWPLPGARLRVTVTEGGGTLGSDSVLVTDSAGTARLAAWTLGEDFGANAVAVRLLPDSGQPAAPAPVVVRARGVAPATSFAALHANYGVACGLTPSGVAFCWGTTPQNGGLWALGQTSPPERRLLPTRIPADSPFVAISAGALHTCGLTAAGTVLCAGSGGSGALGTGDLANRPTFVPIAQPPGVRFVRIEAGGTQTCALAADGQAWCWGNGLRVGDGTTTGTPVAAPVRVRQPAGVRLTQLSARGLVTCGRDEGGDVYCWGLNTGGAIGNGEAQRNALVPERVLAPAGVRFAGVSAGNPSSCAWTAGGDAYCWGQNTQGEVGVGDTLPRLVPTRVAAPAGLAFRWLRTNLGTTCGLATDGALHCWGQTLIGTNNNLFTDLARVTRPARVALPAGLTVADVAIGSFRTCVLSTRNRAWCWGVPPLGDGSADRFSLTPVLVPLPTP